MASQQIRPEFLLAGVCGGVLSALVLHPLEVLKVRQAAQGQHGPAEILRSILQADGARGLYRGLAANCLGAGLAWGTFFLIYHSLRGDGYRVPASRHLTCATAASVGTLVVTNPLWVVKTQLCMGGRETLRGALAKVFREEGLRGLYRGFLPGLFGVVHPTAQFVLYDEMKATYCARTGAGPLPASAYIALAVTSKMAASLATYPYQVVRIKMQVDPGESRLMDVVRDTWRRQGLAGFYRGLLTYLVYVTPNVCILFLVYETIVKMHTAAPPLVKFEQQSDHATCPPKET